MPETKGFVGDVILLEEDHVVSPDFLQVSFACIIGLFCLEIGSLLTLVDFMQLMHALIAINRMCSLCSLIECVL
jgi:hypothetical protein